MTSRSLPARAALPPVPDLYGRATPEILTELMLAILNRGDRR